MTDSANKDLSSLGASQVKLPLLSHRLPTVAASDALLDLGSNGSEFLPSGLSSMDAQLAASNAGVSGGFQRGKVSEVWGPNGAGKTGLM
nr:hypothetical protein CFP56_41508 [Quercus suber]